MGRTPPLTTSSHWAGTFEHTIEGRRHVFRTQPGVFSQDGPDEGSRLLLETVLPHIKPHQTILDLGAGVGFIGLSLAGLLTRGAVWLVDSDIRAIRLTEENARLNNIQNAHIILSDITLDLPRVKFDLVLSNPPTHSGKEVLKAFVSESYNVLRPGGRLFLVVNRLLSVREMMAAVFGAAEPVKKHKGFIVYASRKSKQVRRTFEAPNS